ncbi:MAG: pitrilysin family protein, partial [Acidobacteriota bacterium]
MRTSITRVRSPGGPTARKPPVSRPRTSFVRSPVSAGLLLLLLWGSAGHAAPDPGAQLAQIRLDATEVVLGNGLRVILHEDHKAPVVGIMVTYHVGSKDETPGRHGFAHLFEHLMFQGTEHLEGDYFRPLERVGATDVNGMTDRDRTTYFQTVPKNALDLALWLESDRMAHLLGGLDQAALEKQLEVVGSEKRQRQRTAFGAVPTLIAESTYPPEHPYSRRPLGTMEDLKAATLAEIGSWYRAHYHPANALLVIAGDIDPESVRGKVERYFGAIPGKPSGPRRERWVAGRTEETRLRLRTRSGSSRLYMVWNVPEWGSPETDFLEVVGRLLTEGPASRLHRRLVERDGLAVDVTHQLVRGELGSQLILKITAGPGRALGTIEAIVEEEIATLARSGPGAEELERVSAALLGELARRSESVNGYRGKTAILAESALFRGSVSGWRTGLRRMVTAEPGRIRRVVADWLVEGAFVLEAPSAPPLRTAPGTVDRSRLPEVAETPVPDLREA